MIPQKVNSQIAYYDALDLYSKAIKNNRTDSLKKGELLLPQHADVYKILKYYVLDSTSTGEIVQAFNENPFFSINGSVPRGGSVKNGRNLKSLIGGLDVTEYADAIATLMIDRAKQELTIAFFNRFKDFADKNPEFKILFPKTTDNLANLLTYTYPQMLPVLRNGFFEDLKQITFNLEAILELPRYRTLFDNFPEFRIAFRSLKLIHSLENGILSPDELILKFAEFPEWSNVNDNESMAFKNTATTVQFAALLSESLRYQDDSRIWISAKDAKNLVGDPLFTNLYLGLLYQKIANQDLKYYLDKKNPLKATPLKDLFAKQKDNILLMQNKISQFISLAEKVNTSYFTIKKKNVPLSNETNTNEDYFNYMSTSIEIVEFSFSIVKIFDDSFKTDNYITIAKKSNSLYKDIYTRKYTQTVYDLMDILNCIVTLINQKELSDINDSPIDSALKKEQARKSFNTFVNKLEPYAVFMGNIIEADTEAEITAALNNVILPVGSSTIKKNTEGWLGNISIQSYLGAYWVPFKKSPDSTFPNSWDDKFGVIAPIGVSWTPGFCSWRRGGALSVFASLIDLGAIVDYKLEKENRVSDDGSSEEVIVKDYKIELGQIFSPGGYLVYGFPLNLPLSLGLGGQYGPGLSKIDAGGNTVVTNPSWRWNVFLAVDIPLFNLANRNRPLRD